MPNIQSYKTNPIVSSLPVRCTQTVSPIEYLTETQINALTLAFQSYYDISSKKAQKANRGRYWLVLLCLRYTGARIQEVLNIDDTIDIDFRNAEIKLTTLKRHNKNKNKKPSRIVPVPANVISEIATYLAEHPEMRGKAFKLQQSNFRAKFYKLSKEAQIPKGLDHPHILRHTRAIELLRAGVPVTIVQDILGHSALTTTAIYLRMSGQEAKSILKEKGLI